MKRIMACIMAALMLCAALAPALADSEVAPLDGALAALNDAYCALEDSSVAITHAYLLEVSDRDALSEHGAALFGECDACVYIIAEQTVAGFAIPYIMEICYLAGADGSVQLSESGLTTMNAYAWQDEYAGISITDVTEAALAGWPVVDAE